jgi:hypothetical protein
MLPFSSNPNAAVSELFRVAGSDFGNWGRWPQDRNNLNKKLLGQ